MSNSRTYPGVTKYLAPELRLSDFQPKFGYFSDRLAEYFKGEIKQGEEIVPFTITASLMEDDLTYRIKHIGPEFITIYDVCTKEHARNLLSLLKQGILGVRGIPAPVLACVKRVSRVDRKGLYPNSVVLYQQEGDRKPSLLSRVWNKLTGGRKKEKFSG